MSERRFGIDVSLYQGDLDFEAARREGVTFAIVKASEGNFSDPEFEANYRRAKSASMQVGAYHYLKGGISVSEQVTTLLNTIRGKVFEYPIFLDVEDVTLRDLTKSELSDMIRQFLLTLEGHGYWAGFYTNLDWYRNRVDGESLAARFSFWFAYWGTECPLSSAQMWQFGGETNFVRTNKIGGVVCDQDYALVDFPAKIAAKRLNGMKVPVAPSHDTSLDVFNVGDRVRLKKDAVVWGSSERFAAWVYGENLWLREISGERAVVSTQKIGAITGAVSTKYLIKV